MSKTVELTDIVIGNININYVEQSVHVGYSMVDDSGIVWKTGEAVFWLNMPERKDPEGNVLPPPEEWFVLPPDYVPTLVGLRDDADGAITVRLLG